MGQQAQETLIVAGPRADVVELFFELRRQRIGGCDPALHDQVGDQAVAQPHQRRPQDRHSGRTQNQAGHQRALANAAARPVVVRVDRDHPLDARVAARGHHESDGAADRDADHGCLVEAERIEERGSPLVEILRRVIAGRNIGPAVTGVVVGVDREMPGQLGDDLLEDIELRAQRVQQHDVGSRAGLDVPHLDTAHFRSLDRYARVPRQLVGTSRARAQRLHDIGDEHQRNQANDCNYRDRADMHVRTAGPAAEAKPGLLPISRDVQEHLLLACYKARLPSDDHDRHRTCPLARAQAPSYG